MATGSASALGFGGAYMKPAAPAAPPEKEPEPIENFLACKDKEVKIKLHIQAEGASYDIDTEIDTDQLQRIVTKLIKERNERRDKKTDKPGSRGLLGNARSSGSGLVLAKPAAPRSGSPQTHTPGATKPSAQTPPPGTKAAAAAAAGAFFGVDLSTIMDKQREKYPDLKVPRFIDLAIKHILHKGIASEGVFRLSGANQLIQTLKEKLNAQHSDFGLEANEDVHTVTGLLKSFLRELPEPLLPPEFYNELLSLTGPDYPVELQVKLLSKIIASIPRHNQFLLSELCWFLGIVAQNSEHNKMPKENLGRVIGPNILWTHSSNQDLSKMQMESDKINLVATLLITHHRAIFGEVAPPRAWSGDPSFQMKFHSGHKKSVQCFAQTAGGALWTADSSGILRVTDSTTYSLIREINMGKGAIFSVQQVGDRLWVASERALHVYDEAGTLLKEHPFACFHIVRRDPASQDVLVGVWEGVRIFDLTTMEQTGSWNTTNDTKVLYARGNHLWIGGTKALHVYDIQTQQQLKEHKLHQRQITSIVDIGNGRILTSSADMKIAVWDANTLESTAFIEAHAAKVMGAAMLPGTGVFYTCAWDCTIKIWNARTLELTQEIKGQHTDCISHVGFAWREAEKNWYLWTTSWDKFVCVWKLKAPEKLPPPAAEPAGEATPAAGSDIAHTASGEDLAAPSSASGDDVTPVARPAALVQARRPPSGLIANLPAPPPPLSSPAPPVAKVLQRTSAPKK